MLRDEKFRLIQKEYDNFYRSLLKQGKMPVRDTEVGIWGVSVTENVYNLFK